MIASKLVEWDLLGEAVLYSVVFGLGVLVVGGLGVRASLHAQDARGEGHESAFVAFSAVTENFLAQCLGGRAEPIGDAMKASTAQVPHGAQYAPGLAGAIARK